MQKGFESVNIHGSGNATIAVPVIGENGNWFIGNEDTGVLAGTGGELEQRIADLEAMCNELNSDITILNTKIADAGTLVWSNPNPAASFSAQSIIVGDTYDYVEILYQRDMNASYIRSQKIYKMAANTPLLHDQVGGPRHQIYERYCHISGQTVYFDVGRCQYTDNNAISENNNVIIPLYIIGYHTPMFN